MLDARKRGPRGPTPAPVPPGATTDPVPSTAVGGHLPASPWDPVSRLLTDEVRRHPYPFLEELRGRGRVVQARSALVTAHHDICVAVLADAATFGSVRAVHRATGGVSGTDGGVSTGSADVGADARFGADVPFAGALIATDPPEHTRLRVLVERAFQPDDVAGLRLDIAGLADGLLDGLAAQAAVDLVADYAQPLALMVIADVLGVPSADWPQLRLWADAQLDAAAATTVPQRRAALRSQHALRRYLDDLLAARAADPGDALIDAMLGPVARRDPLSPREAGASALLILQAGYETATTLIANAIHALGGHPTQVEILLARPQLWPNAVEEVMRWNPAVLLATRITRVDTHLAGTPAPAGTAIVLALAGANRDPAVFDAPEVFDVGRENAADHLGMGGGNHACVGGALGRLETEVAVRRLFERFPNLRFAAAPVRTSGRSWRGFADLPVRLRRPAQHLP